MREHQRALAFCSIAPHFKRHDCSPPASVMFDHNSVQFPSPFIFFSSSSLSSSSLPPSCLSHSLTRSLATYLFIRSFFFPSLTSFHHLRLAQRCFSAADIWPFPASAGDFFSFLFFFSSFFFSFPFWRFAIRRSPFCSLLKLL